MSTRYTKEFKERAVRLLAESRGNYSSETQALVGVAKDLGVAAESLRRWQGQA
ncbi:transposase, partial [Bifidobacterium subtile]